MDVRSYEYFVALAEQLNFTKTARSLFIETSTLSKIITKMELVYGVKLFVRTKHNVELTAEGQLLLAYARDILAKYYESIQRLSPDNPGKLSICYCPGPETWLLPSAYKQFARVHPNVEISLHNCQWDDLMSEDIVKRADIILTYDFSCKWRENCKCVKLISDPWSLVISRYSEYHSMIKGDRITGELVGRIPLSFVSDNFAYRSIIDMLNSAGITPLCQQNFKNLETLSMSVRAGKTASVRTLKDHIANPDLMYYPISGLSPASLLAIYQHDNKNQSILPFISCMKSICDNI